MIDYNFSFLVLSQHQPSRGSYATWFVCQHCWDATTLNGAHINEVHVNTASGSFALNVGKLPGRTTEDYIDHIKRLRAICIVLIVRLSMTRH